MIERHCNRLLHDQLAEIILYRLAFKEALISATGSERAFEHKSHTQQLKEIASTAMLHGTALQESNKGKNLIAGPA